MTIRRELLIAHYDFWLDVYGAPGTVRKQLRAELRGNLADAERSRGWVSARDALGSIRLLAKDGADAVRDPRRPSWNSGAEAAVLAFLVILFSALAASVCFMDGALAAGLASGQEVTGSLTLLPGVRATAVQQAGYIVGLSISPWVMAGVPALVFLLVSRPWRLVRNER